jgi:hypothetical protein
MPFIHEVQPTISDMQLSLPSLLHTFMAWDLRIQKFSLILSARSVFVRLNVGVVNPTS